MKNYMLPLLGLFLILPSYSSAQDFLGAPLIPQGKVILKTDSRLELRTDLSYDETITFYREALREYRDIKFRDWNDAIYIEDDGKLAWHSITITAGDEKKTIVVIVKDNWTWIFGTLVLRFIGVFMVLLTLFLGMSLSGKIISRTVKRNETVKTAP